MQKVYVVNNDNPRIGHSLAFVLRRYNPVCHNVAGISEIIFYRDLVAGNKPEQRLLL